MLSKEEISKLKIKIFNQCDDETIKLFADMLKHTEQLESELEESLKSNQKLIEKLEEKIQSVEKCYQDLIKPYYDKKLNIINASYMSKKEKEEFVNKKNCLLVQKYCYEEILSLLKGEKE